MVVGYANLTNKVVETRHALSLQAIMQINTKTQINTNNQDNFNKLANAD